MKFNELFEGKNCVTAPEEVVPFLQNKPRLYSCHDEKTQPETAFKEPKHKFVCVLLKRALTLLLTIPWYIVIIIN